MSRGRFHVPIEPGTKFGRWEVLHYSHKVSYLSSNSSTVCVYYNCRCECGNACPVWSYSLRSGNSTECRVCANRRSYLKQSLKPHQGKPRSLELTVHRHAFPGLRTPVDRGATATTLRLARVSASWGLPGLTAALWRGAGCGQLP